ncbi:MAG: DsbA family protein [Hyphomicrobiaceae bacterium]
MTQSENRHFIYFADPMCSWCYGFGPVIRELASRFKGRLSVRVIMGGLKAGETRQMREKDIAYLRDAWKKVHEASGQPFTDAFFTRKTFTYDTEPSCRAVVTMRRLAPDKVLTYLAAVSKAFYADNRDITDETVLAEIAEETGLDRASFLSEIQSDLARQETAGDFAFSKNSGVAGFPLLAAGNETTGYALITHGFRPIDGLPEAIEEWLAKGAPVTPVQ